LFLLCSWLLQDWAGKLFLLFLRDDFLLDVPQRYILLLLLSGLLSQRIVGSIHLHFLRQPAVGVFDVPNSLNLHRV
jgi:hypothetical protein